MGSRSPRTTYLPPAFSADTTTIPGSALERVEIGMPPRPCGHREEGPHRQREDERPAKRPEHRRGLFSVAVILRLEERFEARSRRVEGGGVAVERRQCFPETRVDVLERFLHGGAELGRRGAAYHRGENGMRPLFDPDRQLADLQGIERLVFRDSERVLREVADGREHSRNHIHVLDRRRSRLDVKEKQSGRPLDEEHLLDAIDERVEQDDLGE